MTLDEALATLEAHQRLSGEIDVLWTRLETLSAQLLVLTRYWAADRAEHDRLCAELWRLSEQRRTALRERGRLPTFMAEQAILTGTATDALDTVL